MTVHYSSNTERDSESGFVLVFAGIMLVLLFSFGALAVDLGLTYTERHRLQIAADHASVAGMREMVLNSAATVDSVYAAALAVAEANGMTASELSGATGIQVGIWNQTTSTFLPGSASGPITVENAVKVSAKRSVKTVFSSLMGHAVLTPFATVIARAGIPDTVTCLVPFGIEPEIIENLTYGDEFVIRARDIQQGAGGSGNWGKLNLSGSMHGRDAFIDAMSGLHGCNYPQQIGDMVESEPGFSGVDDGLNQIINKKITLGVTDGFLAGRSDIQLLGFITARFTGSVGNGNNWEGTFTIEKDTNGSGDGGPGDYGERNIVLVQ